ncbi:PREDICTED: WD repeat and SOCS box-containing protein 1 [Pygoscelis adeliae]|uniref:WD repeat and SOCS box-containing protein 1 n=1 Tax=Pygoscelis adeliae TaxID=9238 RepID=UPI0004F4ECE6|nr:PREDICTED: WD repeat and SOCS box-containing protein 1 [Pygoscelis adeliae]
MKQAKVKRATEARKAAFKRFTPVLQYTFPYGFLFKLQRHREIALLDIPATVKISNNLLQKSYRWTGPSSTGQGEPKRCGKPGGAQPARAERRRHGGHAVRCREPERCSAVKRRTAAKRDETNARPRTVGELLAPTSPFDKKCGRENWTVAFAPDGSYFAWSQGHRIVKLVPWSQCLNNFLLHGTKNVANSIGTRLPRQNSDSGQKNKPCEHIIDCGDIVWSLAFGSSVPEKQSRCVNIEWHRFKFGQDQLLLATGLNNGRIKIWDAYTGKLLLNLMDHTEVVRDLTFAPDGSLILVSASRDKTLRVWDLKDDGNMMKVLRGHQNWVYGCAFSPDSSILCSVGASKAVFLWDMDKYSMIRKLEGHHNDVVACEFSPDGALLATASYDTRVYVWDPHIGVILMEFGHLFPPPTPIFAGGANDRWVRSVSFSHDGLHIASLADDKMVRFWRIDEEYPVQVAPLNNGLCCTFSTDGSVLAAGTQDGSVYFWATPRQVSSLQHLCRMAIRRVMPTSQVKNLPIPSKVVEFLCYQI